MADRRIALVGSANLTGRALSHNMELGLVVEGGPVPRRIHDHVVALMPGGCEVEPGRAGVWMPSARQPPR